MSSLILFLEYVLFFSILQIFFFYFLSSYYICIYISAGLVQTNWIIIIYNSFSSEFIVVLIIFNFRPLQFRLLNVPAHFSFSTPLVSGTMDIFLF